MAQPPRVNDRTGSGSRPEAASGVAQAEADRVQGVDGGLAVGACGGGVAAPNPAELLVGQHDEPDGPEGVRADRGLAEPEDHG